MKRSLLLFAALLALNLASNGQSYKMFKADADLGVGSCLSFTLEAHLRLIDQFAVGVRFQEAASGKLDLTTSGANGDSYIREFGSQCLTGDFYLTNLKLPAGMQVFAGGGLGIYSESYDKNNKNISSDNFGFFPRAGMEYKWMRASMEYNVTGGSTGYFTVNFGYSFGGKKK